MKLGTDTKLIVAGAIALGLGIWYVQRQAASALSRVADLVPSAGTVQQSVGQGVGYLGNYIGAAAAGTVEGIGLAVGIPRTDVSQCARDKANGDWWAASFSCPAGDFLSSGASAMFGSTAVHQATQADVRRVDNALERPAGADVFFTPYGIYGGV